MTEDEVVLNLCKWLEKEGYTIKSACLGAARGNDIEAVKDNQLLIVEAKGSKGNLSHTTRAKFDSGQIKTHLGKAIVKVLEQKASHPDAQVAIAHPYDEYLMNVLSIVRQEVSKIGIKMMWIKDENEVFVD